MKINRSLLTNFNPDNDVTFYQNVTAESLSGTGTRMVVANSAGLLSTQALPTSGITGSGTADYVPKFATSTSLSDSILYATANAVGIQTTSVASEGNLYLGAKGDEEGGHLVLHKATTWTYAAHIDNYQDNLRIMSGTNTASSSVKFNLDLLSGILNIGATFAASPSANGRLNVDASANQYSGYFLSSTTTGQSLGLYIQAGTNNADYSLIVQSATGTDYFYVMGDGDVRIPNGSIKTEAPSGGTAKPWKLGAAASATGDTQNTKIEVEIDGVLYYLMAFTV